MIAAARSLLRRLGVEVVRYAPRNYLHLRRPLLLADERIDVVLDVGAHDGSWARSLRESGYEGRIVSFEPLAEPVADRDGRWDWHALALGDRDGAAVFHVSANRKSSSLRPMADLHVRHAPESRVVETRDVRVARLDSLDLLEPEERAYLKLDVQGGELDVLRGAARTLAQVRLVEAELSAAELYEGQPLIGEVIEHLRAAGFGLIAIETAFRDRGSGDLLQANGLFRRRDR
jgi:FkbM family methyltransferase